MTLWGNTDTQMVSNSSVFTSQASSVRANYYPGLAANRAQYDNPEITELIDLAATVGDRAERERIFKRIQELAAEDIPYLGIAHMQMNIGGHLGTGGLLPFPNNNHDWSRAYRITNLDELG
jgi:ABC-type transport system substrate-binding protein